jgi:hypothetical protein
MEASGQLHAPTDLTLGKSPWYPLDRRLGGPQSRSGRGKVQKNSHSVSGLEPPIIQHVAQRYTTELSSLSLSESASLSLYSLLQALRNFSIITRIDSSEKLKACLNFFTYTTFHRLPKMV